MPAYYLDTKEALAIISIQDETLAPSLEKVREAIGGKEVTDVILVPDRLSNVVAR